jgi:hypothetical protein
MTKQALIVENITNFVIELIFLTSNVKRIYTMYTRIFLLKNNKS